LLLVVIPARAGTQAHIVRALSRRLQTSPSSRRKPGPGPYRPRTAMAVPTSPSFQRKLESILPLLLFSLVIRAKAGRFWAAEWRHHPWTFHAFPV